MKKIIVRLLIVFVAIIIFASTAYAWKYKYVTEENGSRHEILFNEVGRIDSIIGDSIVIDDSSYVFKFGIPIKNLESSHSYSGSLKVGMLVAITVSKDRVLTGVWVIDNKETFNKIKQSELGESIQDLSNDDNKKE